MFLPLSVRFESLAGPFERAPNPIRSTNPWWMTAGSLPPANRSGSASMNERRNPADTVGGAL